MKKKTKEQFERERQEYLKLSNSSLYFVKQMFKLTPQQPKPEYQIKYDLIMNMEGEEWEQGKDLITADWFGDYDEESRSYEWFDFIKGKHITWQQTLFLMCAEKAIQGKAKARVSVASGHGCHAKGTEIMMSDGTTKRVEDIVVGDKLMGDDGTPRNVLQLVRGREQMYRVIHKDKTYYDVNENHILALECSNKICPDRAKRFYETSVKYYLQGSSYFKTNVWGYRAPIS